MSHYDVIIVGSGIVGSVAALALAKNTTLKIALFEAHPVNVSWSSDMPYDHRVSAISLASKRLLQNISLWSEINLKRVTPYTKMHVWDETGSGKIAFDCDAIDEASLGFIIEDSVMRTSLLQAISATESIDFIHPVKLTSLQKKPESIELTTHDGKSFSTTLLIGADGANSWVREQAGIALKNRDYEQTAIVATVQTTLPHANTAAQRFLTTGPLAFLPLPDPHTSSIVWSTTKTHADELLALNDELFSKKLSDAFEKKWGDVTHVGKRYHFPLRMRHVKNYVEEHIALIGDAAHTLHPLAGQGVNLGLLDAAMLVQVITDALQKNRDFGSLPTLRRYERARKSDTLAMLACVDALKNLFTHPNRFIQGLRNAGLTLTDRLDPVKNQLMRYATGKRSDLPDIMVTLKKDGLIQ